MRPYCPNNSNFTFREITCLPCREHNWDYYQRDEFNFDNSSLFGGYCNRCQRHDCCDDFNIRRCHEMPEHCCENFRPCCPQQKIAPRRCNDFNLLLFGFLMSSRGD